jgi:hypothetical protein
MSSPGRVRSRWDRSDSTTSVRPCSSETLSNHEDTALSKTPARLCLRPGSPLAPREDSRIATDLGWRLKAPMDHAVIGNSAFFSRSEKATFAEILKLDSISQVLDPRKSNTVPPRDSAAFPFIRCNNITLRRVGLFIRPVHACHAGLITIDRKLACTEFFNSLLHASKLANLLSVQCRSEINALELLPR